MGSIILNKVRTVDSSSQHNPSSQNRNPLIPIGFIIMAMLTIPMWLYSISPDGPMKEGDVVFSTGRHHAYFVEPEHYYGLGYQQFCILVARERLLVLQPPAHRKDGTFVASVIGERNDEFPDCPPQATVILKSHQASLNVDVWGGLKETLRNLF